MYGYAGASAVATKLPLVTGPPQAVNPVGLATQAMAVFQAAGASVGRATRRQRNHVKKIIGKPCAGKPHARN
jgi:PPE-repeat protein